MITTRLMPSIIISSTGSKTRFLNNRLIASLQRLALEIRSVIAKEDIRLCDAAQSKTRVPVSTLGERSACFHRPPGMRPVISLSVWRSSEARQAAAAK
jgi:hypothetical protein